MQYSQPGAFPHAKAAQLHGVDDIFRPHNRADHNRDNHWGEFGDLAKDTAAQLVDFKAAGADGQPTGAPNKTYDFTPHAGAADFDDSKWEVIDPTTLDKRRSAGRLAFNWYRIKIKVPERVGNFDPTGSTLVFDTSIDDYAEIWVDGELPRAAGQSGVGTGVLTKLGPLPVSAMSTQTSQLASSRRS